MSDSLNINKELDILKQSSPVTATALEKMFKCFSQQISNINSEYGSRLTLIQTNSEHALSKVKVIEQEFRKFRDFDESVKAFEKQAKYLSKQSFDFKEIFKQINSVKTDLKKEMTEIRNQQAKLNTLNGLLGSSLGILAVNYLANLPDSLYSDHARSIKLIRETNDRGIETRDSVMEGVVRHITKVLEGDK